LSSEGKYEEAIDFYNKAISADPTYADDVARKLIMISWSLSDEGKYKEAMNFYNKAVSIKPSCASAAASGCFDTGCRLSSEGRYEEAIKYYDRATSINPNYKKAWSNKGNALLKIGSHHEAKICFEKVKTIEEINSQQKDRAMKERNSKLAEEKRILEEELNNELAEEKRILEEELKIILDLNPVTLEEFVHAFLSTYKYNYSEHVNEFKRLLYLSQKRTSDEIEEAIKSYFTNIITREGMDKSLHSSEPIYDFGLIYEFAKKYGSHFDKSDIEKMNKLLLQKGIRFHNIELMESLVSYSVFKQNYDNFKEKIQAANPRSEREYVEQFLRVYKDNTKSNMYYFYLMLSDHNMTDLSFEEFKESMDLKIFEIILTFDANKKVPINAVDEMNGYEFEIFIGEMYEKMGYSVELTPKSGDQGADLIITKFGERTAVQTKKYTEKNVSNKAVQEVLGSIKYYKCTSCSVVTNSYFTKSAIELGDINGVKLVDREELKALIDKHM
jgi:HJR/Mrr/RecB family endonuclease/Tfp pilus assembly protein PilF